MPNCLFKYSGCRGTATRRIVVAPVDEHVEHQDAMFACTPCADTIGMDPGHEVFSLHNVVAVEAL